MQINFFQAYVVTLVIETSILFLLLSKGYSKGSILKNSFIANSFTLPLVWFMFPLAGLNYSSQIIISEVFAFITEFLFYVKLFDSIHIKKAVLASLLCNLLSFLTGVLIYIMF